MNQNGLWRWRVGSLGPFQGTSGKLGGLFELGLEGDDASEGPFDDLVLVPQSLPGPLLELLEVIALSLEHGTMLGEVLVDQVDELLGQDEEVRGGIRVLRYCLDQCLG